MFIVLNIIPNNDYIYNHSESMFLSWIYDGIVDTYNHHPLHTQIQGCSDC